MTVSLFPQRVRVCVAHNPSSHVSDSVHRKARVLMQLSAFLFVLLFSFSVKAQVTINGSGSYATISAAVAAAAAGDVITVAPGIYNENVQVNKSLTIQSSAGRSSTIVNGSATGALGTFQITASNVTIGGFGKGFTIRGYDSPSPGIEYAAVYIQGARSNVTLRENEIVANGEAALLTEFGQAVNGLVVNANIISGKTFMGAMAGDCGFANQFTAYNVPRQLALIQSGSGITFTSNTINGVAGSASSFSGCTSFGQGNTCVTIDASNVVIRGNTFAATSARFAGQLRVRGVNASISCNTFDNTNMGPACALINFNASLTALTGGANPNSLAGVAANNSFINGGAYFTGATDIWLSSAQVTAMSQTPIACNTTQLANVTNVNTGEMFCSIQAAINDANTVNGHTILAGPGMFNEDVVVSKSITLKGSGYAATTLSGPIGGGSATIQVTTGGVVIDGFTITRDGNNTTDWTNAGLNSAGIAIQSQGIYAEVRNCKITGNRSGIDINNSNGNNIHNNIIDNNRTGVIFRNQTDNTNFQNNFVTNNWTLGILFLDGSGGSNVPVQSAANSTFNNNTISGNWYGQVQDRQSGGSIPAPGSNLKNFNCNWFGTTSIATSNANSTEPGYAAQIPVAYGGTATPPSSAPDVLGTAYANINYTPYLINGTDASGTFGFQPVSGSCVGETEAPVINCPSNITVNVTPGQCGAKVCYPSPTVTDNMAPATPAGYTYKAQYGNSYYYQSNSQSNYATAQSNAIAAGGRLAVITSAAENNAINASGAGFSWIGGSDAETEGVWKWSDCESFSYSNFCGGEPNGYIYENHLEFETGGCWNDLNAAASRYAIIEITGAKLELTAGLPQNAMFPVGTTTVTYKATDAAGNSNTCSFTVTVVDNLAPVLNGVFPSGQTGMDICKAGAPAGPDEATIAALYTDNCGTVNVIKTGAPTGDNCVWSVTYTYDVYDGHGNHVNPSPTITFSGGDVSAPVLHGPIFGGGTNISACKSNLPSGPSLSEIASYFTDNCGTVHVSKSASITGSDCPWSVTYTYDVYDDCGNHVSPSPTLTYSGSDQLAPVLLYKKNLTVTLSGGTATITAAQIDSGSYDNCASTVHFSVIQQYPFDCSHLGLNTLIFGVYDDCGNYTEAYVPVTVLGTVPTVSISQNNQPEFCQGGYIILKTAVTGGVNSYLWSTGATTSSIQVNASGTYTCTVTNGNGCTATASTTVNYVASNLLSAYTLIANEEVELKDGSMLMSGGAGALSPTKGEVEAEKNSMITAAGTFARAQDIEVKNGSVISTQILTTPTITLPAFKYNTNCNSNNNKTIAQNATVTLTDAIFDKVNMGKGSTVIFTQPIIYINDFNLGENCVVKFTSSCVELRLCKDLNIDKGSFFNPDYKSVVIYSAKKVNIKKGCTIVASVYCLEDILTDGNNNDSVTLIGMYIADKELELKNTVVYANGTCGSCTANNKTMAAAQADERGVISSEELVINAYPNPSNGKFALDIITPVDGNMQVTVYDYTGKEVFATGTMESHGTLFVPIDLSAQASGYYLVKATFNGVSYTKRMMIQTRD